MFDNESVTRSSQTVRKQSQFTLNPKDVEIISVKLLGIFTVGSRLPTFYRIRVPELCQFAWQTYGWAIQSFTGQLYCCIEQNEVCLSIWYCTVYDSPPISLILIVDLIFKTFVATYRESNSVEPQRRDNTLSTRQMVLWGWLFVFFQSQSQMPQCLQSLK